MTAPAPPVIALREVSKVYAAAGEQIHALRSVSLEIRAGEFAAVVGPSGSGKTTLMNVIGCLDVPTSGRYELSGVPVSGLGERDLADVRNQRIGFVFQTFNLLPRLTAYDNVELPLIYRGLPSRRRRDIVLRRLDEVGLLDRRSHLPAELSGGQRQRVAIARALATEPAILLADEPTGNLDQETGEGVLALFADLHRAGHTIVFVTHNPVLAKRADRRVEIRDGRLVSGGEGGAP